MCSSGVSACYLIGLGLALVYRRTWSSRISARLRAWKSDSRRRRTAFERGFEEAKRSVEEHVRQSDVEAGLIRPLLFGTGQSAECLEGSYRVELKEHQIVDKKTNDVQDGGNISLCKLSLQVELLKNQDSDALQGDSRVLPLMDEEEWVIKGTRKSTDIVAAPPSKLNPGDDSVSSFQNGFFAVSEGIVVSSGRAYWVETRDAARVLSSGRFLYEENNWRFEGEWLTSDGRRGTYTKFDKVPVSLATGA